MPLKTVEAAIDVVQAAKIRIKNIFDTGQKVYLSFSSGKDSICLSHLVYSLILEGSINRGQLTVLFFDEEGLYPSMVKSAEEWRERFLKIGVPFLWFCLPLKQVCCIDSLSKDESWITWDPS